MSSLDNFSSSEGLSVPFEFKREHISFKKETMISNGLLDISSDGGILRSRPSSELVPALAQTPLFPVGDAPVLSICIVEDEPRIMFTVAHLRFIPDESNLNCEEQYLVAATSPRSDQAILLSFPSQSAPQLYLDGFNTKLLTKLTDEQVIRNLDRMSVSSTSEDTSLPVENCVAIPPALFKFLLSQDISTPSDCLLATLHWLHQQDISSFTTTGGERKRKPLSPPLRDLLAFLVLACRVPKNLMNAAGSEFEPFPIGEVYSRTRDLVLDWIIEVEEEDPLEDPRANGIPENVETEQQPPMLVRHVPGRETEVADRLSRPQETQQLQQPQQAQQPQQVQQPQQSQQNNLANDLVVSFLENLNGLKKRTSSSFFDQEGHETLERTWRLLGSIDGSLLDETPAGVVALYKQKDGAAMARTLNAVTKELASVSPAVMATLRNDLSTNSLFNQKPKGLSILMLKAKDESVDIAEIMGTANAIDSAMLPELLKGQNFEDLLHAKVTVPESMIEMEFVLQGYLEILKFLIPGSLLQSKFSGLVSLFNKKKAVFNSFYKVQKKHFLMAFLNGVNSTIARFVNSCCEGNPVPSILRFEDLVSDVECGNFMNIWKISSAEADDAQTSSGKSTKSDKSDKKPKKKQKLEDRTCDCPELLIDNWGEKANAAARKALEESKGISTPVIRGKEMCCRFYFNGKCGHSNCKNRAHFVNLTQGEKSLIAKYRSELLG